MRGQLLEVSSSKMCSRGAIRSREGEEFSTYVDPGAWLDILPAVFVHTGQTVFFGNRTLRFEYVNVIE